MTIGARLKANRVAATETLNAELKDVLDHITAHLDAALVDTSKTAVTVRIAQYGADNFTVSPALARELRLMQVEPTFLLDQGETIKDLKVFTDWLEANEVQASVARLSLPIGFALELTLVPALKPKLVPRFGWMRWKRR